MRYRGASGWPGLKEASITPLYIGTTREAAFVVGLTSVAALSIYMLMPRFKALLMAVPLARHASPMASLSQRMLSSQNCEAYDTEPGNAGLVRPVPVALHCPS